MATLGNFVAGQVLTAAELNAIAAWTSFTPTWTGLTVGNGTETAFYAPIADLTFMQVALTFGSTTSITAGVTIAYPVAADDTFRDGVGGQAQFRDDDTGNVYHGVTSPNSGTIMNIRVFNSSGTYLTETNLTSTIPFTWATGDRLIISHWFRAA